MHKTVVFEPVKSSQIKEIGHLDDTLYIKFRKGKIYTYRPVTQEKFEAFKKADSLGSYFHKNFKANSELIIKQVNNEH